MARGRCDGRWVTIRIGRHHWVNPPLSFQHDPDAPNGVWQRNMINGIINDVDGAAELEDHLIRATKMGNTIIFVRDRLAHTFFCHLADEMLLDLNLIHQDENGPTVNFPPAIPPQQYQHVAPQPLGPSRFMNRCGVREEVWRQLSMAVCTSKSAFAPTTNLFKDPTQAQAIDDGTPAGFWAEHFSAQHDGVMAGLRLMGMGDEPDFDMVNNLDGIWDYQANVRNLELLIEADVSTAVA
ncbi:hypothetical protein HDU96_002553, partial [Phlyctochytrium bullatum]